MNLVVGDKAPDFTLPTDSGEVLSLSTLLNKKNVVLYFYPKDDTPGCTIEAKDFRDNIDSFSMLNTEVIGVSQDSIKCHAHFKTKYSLPFTLVSDESAEILKKYGVLVEKSMFFKKYMGIERSTFLLDKNGQIVKIWRRVKVYGHIDEILKEIKNLLEKRL